MINELAKHQINAPWFCMLCHSLDKLCSLPDLESCLPASLRNVVTYQCTLQQYCV